MMAQGETDERNVVRLTILSGDITAGDLADLVGQRSDESWTAGTPHEWRGRTLARTHPFHGIRYVSQLPEGAPVSSHIRDVVDRIGPDGVKRIAELCKRDDVERCRLSIGVFDEGTDSISVLLDAEVIAIVKDLGVDILVDTYSVSSDDL